MMPKPKPPTSQTGPKRIPQKQIIAALDRNAGGIAAAARELGIDRSGLFRRIKRTPALSQALIDVNDLVLDAADGVIKQAILRDQNIRVACWYVNHRTRVAQLELLISNADVKRIVDAVGEACGIEGLQRLRDEVAAIEPPRLSYQRF
jgi:hypothetical protein